VLITLGVIGVVAALTIPNLMKQHEKQVIVNQLKVNTSSFAQAIQQYMMDEGVDDLSQSNLYGNTDELVNFFHKYIKLAKDCNGLYYGCFGDVYTNIKKTASMNFTPEMRYSCAITGVLPTGASVCADVYTDKTYVMGLEIDVNGKKGPNAWGKDFQSIYVRPNGTLFDVYWEEHHDWCRTCGANSVVGTFGQIMADGWKITYY
jgi:type II secretory pathway pseudopilin PulG